MIRFITGTDTGVGKTAVAAAMAQRLRKEGKRVAYYKPVQTGVRPGEPGDAQFVAAATGIEVHEGQRFAPALAPSVAAEEAGQEVRYEGLLKTGRKLAGATDVLLVEGAGGLLVPLTIKHTMADLALDLGLAVETELVIVVRPGLGTLNHTALTLEVARGRELSVAGVVVARWPADPGVLELRNLELLSEMAPILGLLGEVPGLDTAAPGPVDLPFLPQHGGLRRPSTGV